MKNTSNNIWRIILHNYIFVQLNKNTMKKDTQGYNLFFESKKQKDELRQIVTDLNKKGEYVSMKEVILNALKKQYPQLKAIKNGEEA